MDNNDREILINFLEDIKTRIQQNIPSVTGKTAASLEVVVDESSVLLTGAPWLYALEKGRGPRRGEEDWGMWKNIQEWLSAKGLDSSNSSAKSLTWWINKYGTELYRSHQVSGVLSDVINPGVFNEVINQIADRSMVLYLSQFLQSFRGLNK